MKRVIPARRLQTPSASVAWGAPAAAVSDRERMETAEAFLLRRKLPHPNPYQQPDGRIQIGPTDV